MRTTILAASLSVLASLPLVAQQPQPTRQLTAVERDVLQVSKDWFNAVSARDVETLDRLQADDFLVVQQGPKVVAVVNKADQLANLRKAGEGSQRLERDLSNIRIRQYGNVAVLTAVASYRQSGPRQNPVSQSVVTEVWVTEKGRWRLAHVQSTDVPQR